MDKEHAFTDNLDDYPFLQWPRQAVLAFTRKELNILKRIKPGGQSRKPLFGGMTTITTWPDLVLAGPILGAPQAAMTMERLSREGVRNFISLGWCGSLQPDLVWGDIVMPETALSEEGTSAHYPLYGVPPEGDPVLTGRLSEAMKRRGIRFRKGRVWTTDAPFRETRDKVEQYSAQGVLAVDMETSAIMTVARFRGLSWAGLMVVSDELWGEKWRPGFKSRELREGLTRAAEVIMEVTI